MSLKKKKCDFCHAVKPTNGFKMQEHLQVAQTDLALSCGLRKRWSLVSALVIACRCCHFCPIVIWLLSGVASQRTSLQNWRLEVVSCRSAVTSLAVASETWVHLSWLPKVLRGWGIVTYTYCYAGGLVFWSLEAFTAFWVALGSCSKEDTFCFIVWKISLQAVFQEFDRKALDVDQLISGCLCSSRCTFD